MITQLKCIDFMGLGKWISLVKFLHKDISSDPHVYACTLIPTHTTGISGMYVYSEARDREIPDAWLPADLAKLVSSEFREIPCLTK